MVTRHRVVTSWDALVAFAMLLALETQLRTGDGPLGPGELLLLLWLAPVSAVALLRIPRHVPRPFWEVVRFWSVLAAALCMGSMMTILRDVNVDLSLVIHDIAAYALLVFLTCALTIFPDAADRLYRILWMIVLFGSTLLLLQLANSAGWFTLPRIDPWYWDRMRGWSDNPNQFALLCLLLGFLAVALAEKASGVTGKTLASVCAGVAFGTGLLAKSNAYSAVIIAGMAVFLLAKLGRAFFLAERSSAPLASIAVAIAAGLGWAVCVTAPVTGLRADALKQTTTMARGGEGDAEDAALRVQLWTQAIKVGAQSWALGLGPGPHLEIPPSILAGRRDANVPINLQHPKAGLAPNFEAHNTVLELFVQGGLVAVAAFISTIGLGAYRSWKAEADGKVALIFAMMVFGSFHVVFRHPLVWFVICLALVERPRAIKVAFAPRRSHATQVLGRQPIVKLGPIARPPAEAQPEIRF